MSLIIKNLNIYLKDRQILKDISLEVKSGTLHALMGPNGSGKSTFAQALMGNPDYKLKAKSAKLKVDNKNILGLKTDERARLGLFLAFQNPVGIPGVTVAQLLRSAYQLIKNPKPKTINHKPIHNTALSVWEFNELLVKKAKTLSIPQEFLRRGLNEEFSGGEKKKLEMLQTIILTPAYAIFDEIDTGLDVDALKIVASGINELKNNNCGVIIITHYNRILHFLKPDYVHILVGGRIVETGSYKLAQIVEKKGYKQWIGEI